jgi:serine/threonine protein kinase
METEMIGGAKEEEEGEEVPMFINSGVYGCYYYPRIPCEELSDDAMAALDRKGKMGSKVQLNKSQLRAEIRHSQKLQSVTPKHSLYFVMARYVCALLERQRDELTECAPLFPNKRKAKTKGGGDDGNDATEVPVDAFQYDTKAKYINMLMRNVDNATSIIAYMRGLPHTRRWSTLLYVYQHVMEGLCHMKRAQLVHWDLHSGNILVDRVKGVPYIIDFGLSIDVTSVNERYHIASHFPHLPSLDRWPVETHLMLWGHHLAARGVDKSAKEKHAYESTLPQYLEIYVHHMSHMDICSHSFRQRYLDGLLEFYAGFRLEHALSDAVWLGWDTWDNYAVSVLFLNFLCSLYSGPLEHSFPVNNVMLRDFVAMLLRNVHYDWRRRPTVEETLEEVRAIGARSYEWNDLTVSREFPTFLDGAPSCAD